jgi:hypothetical protein
VPASKIRVEDQACFDGPRALDKIASGASSGRAFAMDIVILPGGVPLASDESLRARSILLDVSIPNPAAVTHIRHGSADTARVAAAAVETDKANKYEGTFEPLMAALVPFIVESYGRLGGQAQDFLRQLVDSAMGDTRASQSRATLVHKLYQTLSVGLQRALSRRESAYRDKLRDHGILPPSLARTHDPLWDMTLQAVPATV